MDTTTVQYPPVTALGHSDMLRAPAPKVEPARKPKSIERALWLLAYRRTADGIARYLAKRGFLPAGYQCHTSTNCPVAQFLIEECGIDTDSGNDLLDVQSGVIRFQHGFDVLDPAFYRQSIAPPVEVAQFIRLYDQGYYAPKYPYYRRGTHTKAQLRETGLRHLV